MNQIAARTDATLDQCHEFAEILSEGPVKALTMQGKSSYTVMGGANWSVIVQFRAMDSPLEWEIYRLSREIHPRWAPLHTSRGTVGGTMPLFALTMSKVPGISFAIFQEHLDPPTELRSNTVRDLATYFAQAFMRPVAQSDTYIRGVQQDLSQRLNSLNETLPDRLRGPLNQVIGNLPLLFANGYPLTLEHNCLCDVSIFVSPIDGRMTGVTGWTRAKVLPFGLTLWALETVLGTTTSNGWEYYARHRELKEYFWEVFREVVGDLGISEPERNGIRIAKIVGYFLEFGFQNGRPLIEGTGADWKFRFLDTLLEQEQQQQ